MDPMQDAMMRNPVVGVFMQVASIANTVVGMIKLTENKDHLKENREDLEKAKLDLDKEPDAQTKEQHERKEERRSNLGKAIERNEAAQKERERQAKEKKERREGKEGPGQLRKRRLVLGLG
ncbi:MAG: hypothetical protein IPK73_30275 [Candidatus Obscuribacter sp.]|nr:hypothetical protein [Candidatus Obscuribacter sp.]